MGQDFLNQQFAVAGQTLGGYLVGDQGCLRTFFLVVNGASTPSLDSFIDVINDLSQISVLLQQEASH
ncbi:hypothetical protein P3T37_002913 [Kitasatospora sp. MAA4]|nr:hypothetical protein [Kitasatospora sp. MAA4]